MDKQSKFLAFKSKSTFTFSCALLVMFGRFYTVFNTRSPVKAFKVFLNLNFIS